MTIGNGKQTAPLSLTKAREATPPVTGIGIWAKSLKAAAFDAIAETDVQEIMAKQIELAKGGKVGSAQFIMGFIAASAKERPAIQSEGRVTVEGENAPTERQYRRLIAMCLAQSKQASLKQLHGFTEIPESQLKELLEHNWFECAGGNYSLTPAGRNAVE